MSASQEARSSFSMSPRKLGMWIFLAGDGMTFGSLLAGYGSLRFNGENWPVPRDVLDLPLASVMTLLLIGGSLTISKGIRASNDGTAGKCILYLALTALAGFIFLGLQAYEWYHLLSRGVSLSSSPFGNPVFGASFFVITGFHGAHVLAGVVFLVILIVSGTTKAAANIEIAALYWHFVDFIWLVIFGCVYVT